MDSVIALLNEMERADLEALRTEVRRAIDERVMRGNSLIGYEHMSTLELMGLKAMIEMRLYSSSCEGPGGSSRLME